MLSTIGVLRTALQNTTDVLDTGSAVASEDLASIVSSRMQWDLDCSDVEERFRYERASLAVKFYACTWKTYMQMMCTIAGIHFSCG